jgi:hypothetical protein
MSEPKTITVNRVDVDLLREQRDDLLEILADAEDRHGKKLVTPPSLSGSLDGLINLLDSMLDEAEGYAEGPSLTEYESSIDGCTVLHVNTPHDWPENERGPIVRIYLNDDTDAPIFNNPRA